MDKDNKSGVSAGKVGLLARVRRFISETVAELGRCTWPTRPQLIESTILVVIAVVVLAVFVAGVDFVAGWLIRLLTVRQG